jgi:hypothetical protein
LLETKFGEYRLKLAVGFPKRRQGAVAFGFDVRVAPRGVFFVHVLIQFADPRGELLQRAKVCVAVVHLFFQNHAVEPFARRLGQQFFRERDMFLAGKTEAVDD